MSDAATKALGDTLKLLGGSLNHAHLDAACNVSAGLANLRGAALPVKLIEEWSGMLNQLRVSRSAPEDISSER